MLRREWAHGTIETHFPGDAPFDGVECMAVAARLRTCPRRYLFPAQIGDERGIVSAALPLLDHASKAVTRPEATGGEYTGVACAAFSSGAAAVRAGLALRPWLAGGTRRARFSLRPGFSRLSRWTGRPAGARRARRAIFTVVARARRQGDAQRTHAQRTHYQ
jgi:hypothetical protein